MTIRKFGEQTWPFGWLGLLLGAALAALAGFTGGAAAQPTFTTLYSFTGGSDGGNPFRAGLVFDASGNLYGTTSIGGSGSGPDCDPAGCGTVFQLAPNGDGTYTESVLYNFAGIAIGDGATPRAGLVFDPSGNLFGTTLGGGNGYGTVFELAPDGTETVLYRFAIGFGGVSPQAGVILDAAGNLYGTALYGHTQGYVFKLAPDGTETLLHAFIAGSDGAYPQARLIFDAAGNLYGTTEYGGASGGGTVFELTPTGSLTLLHSFSGGDGQDLRGGDLVFDASGNLYGTTNGGGANGLGTVFKLAPDGTLTTLYSFAGGSDGRRPQAGLIFDAAGNLYGTTRGGGGSGCGGPGCGTVFQLAPDGTETVLHSFVESDGAQLAADVIFDEAGNLYGTAQLGGRSGCGPAGSCGTVFQLTLPGAAPPAARPGPPRRG